MRFDRQYLGPHAFTAGDDHVNGANYGEVREVVFRNPYYLAWGAEGEPPLPIYDVTLGRVLSGFLPGGQAWAMRAAAERTIRSRSLLRWGENGQGFRRLLHPNGVCLFGRWRIDEETEYSGYFKKGSEALLIARYSTCCNECRRGYYRSLSLVGTLFPTLDKGHVGNVPTASFITQEDLGGNKTNSIDEAVLRNAPDVTPSRRGWGVPILLATDIAFRLADREPTRRQLYEIAELDKPKDQPTRSPKFMQLTIRKTDGSVHGYEDFRDEVLSRIYDPGDTQPKRELEFDIEITDEGTSRGLLGQRRLYQNWKRVGKLTFTEAVASYNGDFVLHMHHPKWRRDLE